MKPQRSARAILVAAVVCSATTGCELITKVDRSLIPDEVASGSSNSSNSSNSSTASSSSSSGGAGGMAGSGGMGGVGGMGGAGGGVTCDSNGACDDQNPCTTETCDAGFCVFTVLDGVPTPGVVDSPGDCNTQSCVSGIDTVVVDDQDVPDDGFECTTEACFGGVPSFMNAASGQSCGAMMDLVCNGNGVCVGCNAPTDCQGQDSICQTRTCIGGTCGFQNAPLGTFVDEGVVGDCRQTECNGAGGITSGPKDTDLPSEDGNSCTGETCAGGIAYHPFLNAGTTCNQNGGTVCNGGGACVECLTAATCPGQDTQCQTRICSVNKCGFIYAPAGMPITGQTSGDCQVVTCNGAGATTTSNDDFDVPGSDGNTCTDEACINGVPEHPNVPSMTPCSQGGGTFCAAGTCVQCLTSADCPGTDTECSVRTCNAGMCGNDFTNAGTPLQNQTPSNCRQERCDGVGGIQYAVDDADIPNDGQECTQDVCNSGTPSNPPLPIESACSQNGGTICNGNGTCVPVANVLAVTPADTQTNTQLDAPIVISFSTAMNPATLTGQTTYGPCIGSVQLSADNFVSCLAFGNASAMMNAGNDVATLTPAAYLSYLSTYKIRILTTAQSAGGVPISAQFDQNIGFVTKAAPVPCGGSVVISQIYGGGGDLGSTLKQDFVELHNRGNTPVSVNGWSLQYAYPTGNFNSVPNHTTPLTGIIPAGGYYLIQLAGEGEGTNDLPTPDAVGATAFDSNFGKVALVNSTVALSGGCPNNASIVDFVGYGFFSNCFEGTSPAPSPSTPTISVTRIDDGCIDSGDNNADFSSNTANPRTTALTVPNICACGANVTANGSGRADEMDYCNIQFPLSLSVMAGQTTPLIYGRAYEAGITDPAGANPTIVAEVGFGPENVNPSSQAGFTFVPATFNQQYGNDDEYQASFIAPLNTGAYRYVVRFSRNGVSWTYCDTNGAGSNAGLTFDPLLTVTP
jgi:hypothetical protein